MSNRFVEDDSYERIEFAILDIMANTDAPYQVAVLAAQFVYKEGWQFNNHPRQDRGVVICKDFDDAFSRRIHIA